MSFLPPLTLPHSFRSHLFDRAAKGGDTISAAVSNEANIALRKATRVGNVDGARAALGAGASVFVADKSGNTALHWACINRHPTLVSVLLSADANPNAANRNGNTPLHAACSKGLATAVERLLAAGADPTLLDAKGDNAHDVALAWGSDRCAAIVAVRLEGARARARACVCVCVCVTLCVFLLWLHFPFFCLRV